MELLSPAGNFEKMVAAVAFGADAVYFGGPSFGLRAFAGNFTFDEMEEAFKFLHEKGKKGYIAVNIFPSTNELAEIEAYLKRCESLGADGLIISDPGIFSIARKAGIKTPISISTQANTTNLASVNFWSEQGAKRVIMAREVGAADLAETVKNATCEIEVFIHGAVCISMSGRCLISSYMTGRDANRGECTHPCRWNYSIVEESRPGEHFPVYEDQRGTYLYNSKDLCLINKLGELEKIGVKSGKIEGRMKSVMYVSVVTGVYRAAIDRAKQSPDEYTVDDNWLFLLNSVSNRGYTEGFYGGVDDNTAVNRETGSYRRDADFLGVVTDWKDDQLIVTVRSKFLPMEKISVLSPDLKRVDITPEFIYDENNGSVENTRPNYTYKLKFEEPVEKGSLLMRF